MGVWEGVGACPSALQGRRVRVLRAGVAAGTLGRSQLHRGGNGQGLPHARLQEGLSLQAKKGLSPAVERWEQGVVFRDSQSMHFPPPPASTHCLHPKKAFLQKVLCVRCNILTRDK